MKFELFGKNIVKRLLKGVIILVMVTAGALLLQNWIINREVTRLTKIPRDAIPEDVRRACLLKGMDLAQSGKIDEAIALYEEFAEKNPEEQRTVFMLQRAAQLKSQQDIPQQEKIAAWERVYKNYPDSTNAFTALRNIIELLPEEEKKDYLNTIIEKYVNTELTNKITNVLQMK